MFELTPEKKARLEARLAQMKALDAADMQRSEPVKLPVNRFGSFASIRPAVAMADQVANREVHS